MNVFVRRALENFPPGFEVVVGDCRVHLEWNKPFFLFFRRTVYLAVEVVIFGFFVCLEEGVVSRKFMCSQLICRENVIETFALLELTV